MVRIIYAQTETDLKQRLRRSLETARQRTLWLLDQVPEEFLKRRVHSFYSPIGWHFGHVGRTEEYWICYEGLGQPVVDDHLSFLFADLPENPKDNRVNLPSREEIKEYLSVTRNRALQALDSTELDPSNPFLEEGYAWDFALQHECQHQETICEMLQLIHKQLAPGELPLQSEWPTSGEQRFIEVPAGEFCMGTDEVCVYDNEHESHLVSVNRFKLAETQVTAAQWRRFMEEGGYKRPQLWSNEGWAWRCTEDASCPEYWLSTPSGFFAYGSLGIRPIHPEEPVGSISWFEADAYCRWAGKRMPTESEWEYAASFAPNSAIPRVYPWGSEEPNSQTAVFGMSTWGQQPVGQKRCGSSALGIQDMAGNVWEWTSSRFLPYPGFRAFPYDGYSLDHMKGEHYVCRGGSWATASPILRCTFRNWYVPTYRQGFLGLRCADD